MCEEKLTTKSLKESYIFYFNSILSLLHLRMKTSLFEVCVHSHSHSLDLGKLSWWFFSSSCSWVGGAAHLASSSSASSFCLLGRKRVTLLGVGVCGEGVGLWVAQLLKIITSFYCITQVWLVFFLGKRWHSFAKKQQKKQSVRAGQQLGCNSFHLLNLLLHARCECQFSIYDSVVE